jgi:purine-cytosine permease-like protein
MAGLFILVGYFIGERNGDWYGLLGTLIGGAVGFIIGVIGFLQLLDVMGRKQDNPKICPVDDYSPIS